MNRKTYPRSGAQPVAKVDFQLGRQTIGQFQLPRFYHELWRDRSYIDTNIQPSRSKLWAQSYPINSPLDLQTPSPPMLLAILQHISYLLKTCSYATLISLDFYAAFDTVWHFALAKKLSGLDDILDHMYNWLVNFLSGRKHVTRFGARHQQKPRSRSVSFEVLEPDQQHSTLMPPISCQISIPIKRRLSSMQMTHTW